MCGNSEATEGQQLGLGTPVAPSSGRSKRRNSGSDSGNVPVVTGGTGGCALSGISEVAEAQYMVRKDFSSSNSSGQPQQWLAALFGRSSSSSSCRRQHQWWAAAVAVAVSAATAAVTILGDSRPWSGVLVRLQADTQFGQHQASVPAAGEDQDGLQLDWARTVAKLMPASSGGPIRCRFRCCL